MPQDFQAIYEHGVLRPLTPLNLPDATPVVLTLHGTYHANDRVELADCLLGSMGDEPELIDQVVEAAMVAREAHPLRAGQ